MTNYRTCLNNSAAMHHCPEMALQVEVTNGEFAYCTSDARTDRETHWMLVILQSTIVSLAWFLSVEI